MSATEAGIPAASQDDQEVINYANLSLDKLRERAEAIETIRKRAEYIEIIERGTVPVSRKHARAESQVYTTPPLKRSLLS
ncbi:uncharacterized protein LDX57_008644 [Aspergillus melleus]|uniref:uncharacterized protein n=1 Tax=Aspergillus melleus TaxID=138277 RepID=UPI001E8DB5EB|nr:uncharacterized protein LDX57_008644 [Aspergillus melleus]KAH8430982.1 hypothetical protein LDX57_008644 [Aspergillus melleus]